MEAGLLGHQSLIAWLLRQTCIHEGEEDGRRDKQSEVGGLAMALAVGGWNATNVLGCEGKGCSGLKMRPH